MKVKIKDLNPNPFKKEINNGKLDEEVIAKILSNIEELGLMGSIPVVKRKGKLYLVSHHHRTEALKRKFGKDYEVNIDLKNYSDDQLLRGMVIENLTQRNNEYAEEEDNILAIRKHLIKNKILLDDNGISVHPLDRKLNPTGGRPKGTEEIGSIRQICLWLDKDKGEVMRRSTVADRIAVSQYLSPILKSKIEKISGGKAPEDVVTVKQAVELVRTTKDKKEQEDLWKTMKREDGRPHELLIEYKGSSEVIKNKVRGGELKLSDVKIENLKEDIKAKIEEQKKRDKGKIVVKHYTQYQREAGSKVGQTNDQILQTCIFFKELEKVGVLYELDWKTMLQILESGTKYGKAYSEVMNKIVEGNAK